MYSRHQTGTLAEDRACRYLTTQGLKLLERNWRCATGEIDLIMQDVDDIVFIEVRARKTDAWGKPVESVDSKKRKKILRTSVWFLQHKHWLNRKNYRFDIISICADRLEWIKNAFDADWI